LSIEKNTNIKQMIREFMVKELKDSGFHENIHDNESLIDSQVLDSLSILQLISFMDEKFGFFPDDDELTLDKLDTINHIEEFNTVYPENIL